MVVMTAIAAPAAEAAGGVQALGLDWRGLIFQVINFMVLLWLLRRFAFRPLLRVLEQRRQTIAESLESAAEIERQREEVTREQRARGAQARREAEALVARSEREAQAIIDRAQAAGEAAASVLLSEAAAKTARQVASAKRELKREVLGLVAAASERVLRVKVDVQRDAALIESALAEARRALHKRVV